MARTDWLRPSVLALIAANLIPLVGVFVFGWKVFPLLLMFWCENVIIGFFNALKMVFSGGGSKANVGIKFALIPFFCFHYGMFTFVHGVFVMVLFGPKTMGFPGPAFMWESIRENGLILGVLGLFLSHAVSFVHNFLSNGEFRRVGVDALMMQPYGRIFVLHLTILLGGLLMVALNSPTAGLVMLIVFKILLDLRGHLAERAKFATAPPASQF